MRIAVSSGYEKVDSDIFTVFGRCPYFIIFEVGDGKIKRTEVIKNKSAEQTSGAGVATAQLMAEEDVNVVIAKNIGPRALDVLKQFNIKTYSGSGSAKSAVEDFLSGKLEKEDLL